MASNGQSSFPRKSVVISTQMSPGSIEHEEDPASEDSKHQAGEHPNEPTAVPRQIPTWIKLGQDRAHDRQNGNRTRDKHGLKAIVTPTHIHARDRIGHHVVRCQP